MYADDIIGYVCTEFSGHTLARHDACDLSENFYQNPRIF